MILSWMLYVVVVSVLLCGAAWILERVGRPRRWPVRWLWASALAGSIIVPGVMLLGPPEFRTSENATIAERVEAVPSAASVSQIEWMIWTEPLAELVVPRSVYASDGWVTALWGLLSGLILTNLVLSYLNLRRRQRSWTLRMLQGRRVWVSPQTGPAVVGFLPSRIVLPHWLLTATPEERDLALTHEDEHIRARDSHLLLAARLLWVLLPWNPALLWMWRSLRRAVEIDCDQRVLSRGVDPRAYSRVLVRVMEQGSSPALSVAALSESPSFLERRVELMLSPRSGGGWPRLAGAMLLASACVLAACQVERPGQGPIPSTGATYAVEEDGSLTALSDEVVEESDSAVSERVLTPLATEPQPTPGAGGESPVIEMLRLAIERYHPNLLTQRVPGGKVAVYFLSDARGEIVRTAADTELPAAGECFFKILRGRLGGFESSQLDTGICGPMRVGYTGPNEGSFFWVALKPAAGEADASPTGPFLLKETLRSMQRDQPNESVLRAAVERHHPDVLRSGLEFGEGLWFVADRNGQVLHSGRGWTYASSETARGEVQRKLPHVQIGNVMMSSIRTPAGETIPLVWATRLEPGAVLPAGAAGTPHPFAHTLTYAVTTPTPGQEVRINIGGEAANNPNAFRISGQSALEGDVLVARTPFLFIVVTQSPFRVSMQTAQGLEMQIATESEGGRTRFTGSSVRLRRDATGGPILTSGASAGVFRRPQAPDVILSLMR